MITRPRSIRRLVAGSTVLALAATLMGTGAAAPVVAQDAAAKFSEKALNAMPKKARNPFTLTPLSDRIGDAPTGWMDIDVAAYGLGTLNKPAAKFLNDKPRKAGEWWAANDKPFNVGDVVVAVAIRTVEPWPGDVPGGLVWTVGQDGPDAFGYYGGGVIDPFAGNVIVDNFGIFENDGTFFPGGGRTSLAGLTLGETPNYYDTPGGTGFSKGKTTVAFLPTVLNLVTKRGADEWTGTPSFTASLRGVVNGEAVFDHLAPSAGQSRYFLDGSSLPEGLECYSLGIYPGYQPGATTPDDYLIELSLGGTATFLEEMQRDSSSIMQHQWEPGWSSHLDRGLAYATGRVAPSTALEGAFMAALGLNAAPILDPQRAGFAAGDPTCARRPASGQLCDIGIDQVLADVFGLEATPTQAPFQFPDLSDACLFFAEGMDQPFAVASVGSRPIFDSELQSQIGWHDENCESRSVDLGDEGYLLLCGGGQDGLSLLWQWFDAVDDAPDPFMNRFALEFIPGAGLPPEFVPTTLDTADAAFDPSLHVDPFLQVGQKVIDLAALTPFESIEVDLLE